MSDYTLLLRCIATTDKSVMPDIRYWMLDVRYALKNILSNVADK